MRSCQEALEQISAALDGVLSDAEQAELEQHLSHCPSCSALFTELNGLHTAAMELEDIPAPEGFAERVMERVAAEPVPERAGGVTALPAKKRSRWKGWTAAAAAVAVAALGAAVFFPGYGSDSSASEADTLDSASVCEEEKESFSENSSADTQNGEAAPEAWDQQVWEEDEADAAQTPSLTVYCGVLTLTGAPLPEGLEDYGNTEDASGSVTYTVPADYFFSCLARLNEQNADGFTYEVSGEETAEYGLIVVEPLS